MSAARDDLELVKVGDLTDGGQGPFYLKGVILCAKAILALLPAKTLTPVEREQKGWVVPFGVSIVPMASLPQPFRA